MIIGYDGQTIASIDDLHRILTENAVGVKTKRIILRRFERRELDIVPDETPH